MQITWNANPRHLSGCSFRLLIDSNDLSADIVVNIGFGCQIVYGMDRGHHLRFSLVPRSSGCRGD